MAVSPAATTVGNDTPSAPASRKRPLDPPHELALRAAAEALPGERAEDLVRERPRAAHDLDLLLVLHRPQRLDETRRWHGVDAGFDQSAVPGIRQMRLLEPDSPSGEQLADLGEEVSRGLDEGHALDLAPPCRVAEVRVERCRRVRLDENRSIRALEPGQVADVRLTAEDVRRPGDEQRLFEERRESLDPRHARVLDEELEGLAIPVRPLPDDPRLDDALEHRHAAPLLPLVDVREVHLDHRDREELDRVADRPRVVSPRARVDDHAVRPVERLVAPVDELTLVVRLTRTHGALELARPLVDLGLELGDADPAVERRIAAADHVEVHAVQDNDSHGG